MAVIDQHVQAPAKINLSLHVRGRRLDGYHLIDSLMVPISLYDRLRIRINSSGKNPRSSVIRVESDSTSIPSGPENLAHEAAKLLAATLKVALVIHINIQKRIPIGGGLGGGSSDAAAVLLALNRMLGSPFRTSELAQLATQIGADVSFFVHGRPARVLGVGDQIQPLALPARLHLVVCSDGYPLSTKAVYSRHAVSLTSEQQSTNIAAFVAGRKALPDLLVNDLEATAAQIHPGLLSLKANLVDQGALGALMTGSGSAVFGVWPDSQSAQRAAKRLRRQGLWARAVQTLDVSPAVES